MRLPRSEPRTTRCTGHPFAARYSDADGFLRTGTDVSVQSLERWQGMGREPLPFETSVPRIFAAGDVRRGSMKRVAAAVGEGSSAVASVHRALADIR